MPLPGDNPQFLLRALDAAGIGVASYEGATGRTLVSPRFGSAWGLATGETTLAEFESWLHPLDRTRVREELDRAWQDVGATGPAIEFRCFRPLDGTLRWLRMQVTVEGGQGGGPGQALIVVQDVTDAVRNQERLDLLTLRLENAVSERVEQLERAYAQLRAEMEERRRAEESVRQLQKMEALGQLTGGIAHDFGNLLQAMLGRIELAEPRMSDDKGRDYLATAREAAERGVHLVRQLLAFARKQDLQVESLDIGQVIRDARPLVEQALGARVRLRIELPDGLWPVRADSTQLISALLNLTINGRDAMSGGGTLTVAADNVTLAEDCVERLADMRPGEYVRIRVADTGSGMAPDTMARAFEPFYTTKGPGQGTGLGLSMVYGTMSQLQGGVMLDSREGEGTTVSLFLPRGNGVAVAA